MKQKTITLPHLELLLVELPQGAIYPSIHMGYITARVPNNTYKTYDDWAKKLDVEGEWDHVGGVRYVSEKVAGNVVEFKTIKSACQCEYCGFDIDCYRNYLEQSEDDWQNRPNVDRCYTALESLHSLLKANGVVFENRYDKSLHSAVSKSIENTYESKLQEAEIFREAQKQVWDKLRTHLFIK